MFNFLCACVTSNSSCASICQYVFFFPSVCFLPKCFSISVSLSLLPYYLLPYPATLLSCYPAKLPATLFWSLYLLSVFTVLPVLILWHNLYFYQSSLINFYFIFSSIYWGRIPDIEFERHGLPLLGRCLSKPFKVSTNCLVLFVLQTVTFCFCLFFKFSLVITTGVDACLRLLVYIS